MTLHNLSLLKKHELNAVLYHNPLDEFPDIEGQSHALNLYDEQQKDHDIKTVIRWKTGLEVPNVKYAPQLLRKYYKHLNRLVIENVLYREFYDDTGRVQIKQYCLQKYLGRRSFMYSITRQQQNTWECREHCKNSEGEFINLVSLKILFPSSKTA